MKDLSVFDLRIESHRQIYSHNVSNFFHNVQIINKNAVLLESIKTCDTIICSDFSSLIIQNIKEIHLGRLTASNHHDIFTNMNSLVKSNGLVKPKVVSLPAQMIGPKSKHRQQLGETKMSKLH